MKKVIIKVNTPQLLDYILINKENIKLKKAKGSVSTYLYEFETDKDEFLLNLDTFHPYLQKYWWIKLTFLYFISIFGLFDSHFRPKFVYHYDGTVKLNNELTELRINAGGYQHKALIVEGNAVVEERENSLDKDKRIKRRKVGLFFSTLAILLAIIGIVVAVMILRN